MKVQVKNKLIDSLKGFLIGLIVTIPGFSIGTLAIILNIYERLIDDFSDLIKHPWKIIKKDLFLGIGFIVGFVIDIIAISYLLEHFPMETVCFFVGLVMASIPSIVQNGMNSKIEKIEVDKQKENYKPKKFNYLWEIVTSVVMFALLIVVSLLNAGATREIELSVVFILAMLLSGIIGAGFMIIPGISGSLIVLALGYYDSIINSLKGLGKYIINGETTIFWTYLIVTIVFVIGAILGLVLVSKLLKKLLKKAASLVYFGILGLLIGSPFAITYLTSQKYVVNWDSIWMYLICGVTVILGFLAGIYGNKLEQRNQNKDNDDE